MSVKVHILVRDVNGTEMVIKRNDIRKVEPDTAGITTIFFYRPHVWPIRIGCTVNYFYNNIMYPTAP